MRGYLTVTYHLPHLSPKGTVSRFYDREHAALLLQSQRIIGRLLFSSRRPDSDLGLMRIGFSMARSTCWALRRLLAGNWSGN